MAFETNKRMQITPFIFIGTLVGLCIGAIFALFIFLNVISFGVPFWSMLIIGGSCGFVAAALGWMTREIKLIGAQNSAPKPISFFDVQNLEPAVYTGVLNKLSGHTANMMLNDAVALDIHSLALILGENEGGKIQLPAGFVQHCLCINKKENCEVVNQVLVDWEMKKNKIKYEKFDKAIILKEMSDSDFKKFQDDLNTVIKVNARNPDYSVISIVDCPNSCSAKIAQIRPAVQSYYDSVIGNVEKDKTIEVNALEHSLRQSLKMKPGQTIANWLAEGDQASGSESSPPEVPIATISVIGAQSFSGALDAQMDRSMVYCYCNSLNIYELDLGVLAPLGFEIDSAIDYIEKIFDDSFCNLPSKHMLGQRVLCRKGKLDPSNPEAIHFRHRQVTQMAAYFNHLKSGVAASDEENSLIFFENKLQKLKDDDSCIEGMSDFVSQPWKVLSEIKESVLGGGQSACVDSKNNAALISTEQETKILNRFIGELGRYESSLTRVRNFLSLHRYNLDVSGEDSAEFMLVFLSYLKNMRRLIDAKHLSQNISDSNEPESTLRPKSRLDRDLYAANQSCSKGSLNGNCTIMEQLMAAYTATDLYLGPRRKEIAGEHSNLKNGNS